MKCANLFKDNEINSILLHYLRTILSVIENEKRPKVKMNKDNKRYRQISITESFLNSKKSKSNCATPTMEDNLRNLLAVAAEKRISSSVEKTVNKSPAKNESQKASTSHFVANTDEYEASDSDEIFVPSSQELFPDSEELFPTQSVTEIPQTPETNLEKEIVSSNILSLEIFTDSTDIIPPTLCDDESDDEQSQVSFFNQIPNCSIPLPKLEPLENHHITIKPYIRPGVAPLPYPSFYKDKWDSNHVRMPCSSQSKYPVENSSGIKHIESRWDLICNSLRRDIETSEQLEAAIMQYNSQYKDRWNFHSLHYFLNQYLAEEERLHFFENILPVMINIALDLPKICTQPPHLLKKNKDYYVTMSQKQIGCLMLNAFFCTFPRRNNYSRNRRKTPIPDEYASYPDINFNRLFFGVRNRIIPSNAEKLKCLFNYFRRIVAEEPVGTITFHRQFLGNLPDWYESTRDIKTALIRCDGFIETRGSGMLQVDFANKFVGGGVLGHGCVQEEIRFVICPELIVSRLFVESLGPNEVLIVNGVEQYNKHSGYSSSFKWEGNFCDETPRDEWGRRCTQLVAMDALHFRTNCEQYKPFRIERELNKAFCGFYEDAHPDNLSAVATGNWGCGAFKGNPILKFLIQLMAASQANRDLLYFTFGNKSLKEQLQNIYNFFSGKNIVVGDLWRFLIRYSNTANLLRNEPNPSLYDYICSMFDDDADTEDYIAQTNSETQDITLSDQLAMEKLLKDVSEEDCNTMEYNEPERENPG